MRKKGLALLAALSMIAGQFAALPLSVSAADIWIDDSSAPGGGYWMDEDGYVVDDGSAGSNYIIETYEEPEYEASSSGAVSASSQQNTENRAAGATTGSIAGVTAGTPGTQQFEYTADGEVSFRFLVGGAEVSGVSYSASGGILTVNDASTDYTVIMYSGANSFIASARTVFAYGYNVIYNLDGRKVTAETGSINKTDGSSTHTAPLMYTDGGVEYELTGGANSQTQVISYDKLSGSYVFNYHVYNPTDRTLSIHLNDERGNTIRTLTETVKYKGGDVTVEIPRQIENNGRKYQLRDTISTVTVNYFSTNFEYSYVYREIEAENTDPYSVKVLFREEGTEKALGEDYFTVSAEDIADKATVTYTPSQERSILEGSSRVYYTLSSEDTISHRAVEDYRNVSYTVYYKKQAVDAPYKWTIQLTDAGSGKVLDTITKDVTVDGSGVSYDVDSQLTVDGKNYVLNSQMKKSYTHNYGDEPRTQIIYYDEEGGDIVSAYTLNVQYKSITDNTVFYKTGKDVTIEEPVVKIDAEENYEDSEGNEYVKLAGQDNLTHNFESAKRTVTVYYRDVNDIQNADTVVTQELVNTTVETQTITDTVTDTTTAGTTGGAAGAAPAVSEQAAPAATLTNDTTGEVVTLDEEGVPLSDTADGLTELKDEETPLSSMAGAFSTHRTAFIIGLSAAALAIAAALFFFLKKRKKAENTVETIEDNNKTE